MPEMPECPVPKGVLGKENIFVMIWNGHDWTYFAGPYQDRRDAWNHVQWFQAIFEIDTDSLFKVLAREVVTLNNLNQADAQKAREG